MTFVEETQMKNDHKCISEVLCACYTSDNDITSLLYKEMSDTKDVIYTHGVHGQ